eukprot:2839001-Pleurochrysis_carterae.AAC.1
MHGVRRLGLSGQAEMAGQVWSLGERGLLARTESTLQTRIMRVLQFRQHESPRIELNRNQGRSAIFRENAPRATSYARTPKRATRRPRERASERAHA